MDMYVCTQQPPVAEHAYAVAARSDLSPRSFTQVFVPYANCCDASLACAEDSSMGWGRFCVAAPSDYKVEEETYVDTYADEIPSMTEEPMYGTKPVKKEKPAKEPAYGQKPVETEAPKHGGGYEKPVKEKSVHDKQGPASAY
jgi:hypothetical protein